MNVESEEPARWGKMAVTMALRNTDDAMAFLMHTHDAMGDVG